MKKKESLILDNLHGDVPANYYDNAIKKNLLQNYWHRKRFSEVNRYLEKIQATQILDIGCHGGIFTYLIFKKFKNAKVYGVDISEKAIYYAKKKYNNIKFMVARGENLPFSSNKFDFVTCFEVLEHVENPKKVLANIKRVSKKDANLLIIVPTENLLFRSIWFFWTKFGPGRVWTHTHIQKFTNNNLDLLLQRTGYEIIERNTFLLGMLLIIHAKKV